MLEEITVLCKNCGFNQEFARNPENPGRITCQRCGAIIVRKKPKPRPKEETILLTNKYDTSCRRCHTKLKIGQPVYWTPGKRGVLCESCKTGTNGGHIEGEGKHKTAGGYKWRFAV